MGRCWGKGLSPSIPAMLNDRIALGWFCVFGHGTGTDRASFPDGKAVRCGPAACGAYPQGDIRSDALSEWISCPGNLSGFEGQ